MTDEEKKPYHITKVRTPAPNPLVPVGEFSEEQKVLIKGLVSAENLTDDEFALFLYSAKSVGLDPLKKQIYCVKRRSRDQSGEWVERLTIQTAIDGYRAIGRRANVIPGREPTFKYGDKGGVLSATAYVKMQVGGEWHEVSATAFYGEYVQRKRGGAPTQFWATKPHIMLGKCAEALAYRKAAPDQLAGLYTEDEMAQADNPEGLPQLQDSTSPSGGQGTPPWEGAPKEEKPQASTEEQAAARKAEPASMSEQIHKARAAIRDIIGKLDISTAAALVVDAGLEGRLGDCEDIDILNAVYKTVKAHCFSAAELESRNAKAAEIIEAGGDRVDAGTGEVLNGADDLGGFKGQDILGAGGLDEPTKEPGALPETTGDTAPVRNNKTWLGTPLDKTWPGALPETTGDTAPVRGERGNIRPAPPANDSGGNSLEAPPAALESRASGPADLSVGEKKMVAEQSKRPKPGKVKGGLAF